jgi:myo-inositol-1(or 4)-monophosphatase
MLIAAAREAGDLAMQFWKGAYRQWDKADDQGPVTEADLAVNDLLAARLRAARPGYGWLSEESPDTGDRLSRNRVFVLDPIDGTRAFIAGEAAFSHALAVVENGQVTAGVVYLPALDLLYAAHLGGPATCNGKVISAGTAPGGPPRVLTSKPSLHPSHWRGEAPQMTRHFRPSMAYRLCLVADGSFDAMLTFRPSWEWDVAAASLIARAAGAQVSEARGGTLAFNNAQPQVRGILAAPPVLAGTLIAAMAKG